MNISFAQTQTTINMLKRWRKQLATTFSDQALRLIALLADNFATPLSVFTSQEGLWLTKYKLYDSIVSYLGGKILGQTFRESIRRGIISGPLHRFVGIVLMNIPTSNSSVVQPVWASTYTALALQQLRHALVVKKQLLTKYQRTPMFSFFRWKAQTPISPSVWQSLQNQPAIVGVELNGKIRTNMGNLRKGLGAFGTTRL